MGILAIAGILIGLGVALYLSKSITGPIERVKQGIKEYPPGPLLEPCQLEPQG